MQSCTTLCKNYQLLLCHIILPPELDKNYPSLIFQQMHYDPRAWSEKWLSLKSSSQGTHLCSGLVRKHHPIPCSLIYLKSFSEAAGLFPVFLSHDVGLQGHFLFLVKICVFQTNVRICNGARDWDSLDWTDPTEVQRHLLRSEGGECQIRLVNWVCKLPQLLPASPLVF